MNVRFPTEETEHDKYYMQFEFYKHRYIDIGTSEAPSAEEFYSALEGSGLSAVSEARNTLFNYNSRTSELDDQVQIPYHGNIEENITNSLSTQDIRDVFSMLSGVSDALEGDVRGVIDSIVSTSRASNKQGDMRKPLEASRGVSLNEQTQVFFDSPELRTYSFEFILIPRNYKDAKEAMFIRDLFQYHSSAGLSENGLNWTYPSLFKFKFFRNETFRDYFEPGNIGNGGQLRQNRNLFESKLCLVENFVVTYGDEQYREFYNSETDEYYPARMQMSLSLKEVEYWTRDNDFRKPYR